MTENIAIDYAESHGIIDYRVRGDVMIYYTNWPATAYEKGRTYKVVVDLFTGKEIYRDELKRYYRKGNANLYK